MSGDPNIAAQDMRRQIYAGARLLLDHLSDAEPVAAHALIREGETYLADRTERYDGSYILALAAYNAGPARANRWMKAFGDPRTPGVDPIDWIESIPFDETRNYVQRILEGLVVYRKTLGTPASDPVMAGRAPFRALAENDKPD